MEFLKPDNLNSVWASGGDRLYPGDTKYASGWGVEIPPRQYFNQIDFKQDQMLAHLNQHGLPTWDADTEYQAGKSYIQGTSGKTYKCIQTHTNQDPDLVGVGVYWENGFVGAGDVYTKVEVDDKTTVATTLQAQQLQDNSSLITPLRLAQAFMGSNQSLTVEGFARLPGGFILQWGSAPSTGGDIVIDLPITFPTAILAAYATCNYTLTAGATSITAWGANATSTSQITVRAEVIGLGGRWLALGF